MQKLRDNKILAICFVLIIAMLALVASASYKDGRAGAPAANSKLKTLNADASITFGEGQIYIAGNGAFAEDGVCTIVNAGTYALSGAATGSSILVYAGTDDEVVLLLDNLNLTSGAEPVVRIKQALKAEIVLTYGSVNALADTATGETPGDAASVPGSVVHSKIPLTLSGTGTLSVTATRGDSLHSKDSITINGGTYILNADDDAVHADTKLIVAGGNINIESCYEGLEAPAIDIEGGDICIEASDDGINAAAITSDAAVTGDRDAGGGRPGGGQKPGEWTDVAGATPPPDGTGYGGGQGRSTSEAGIRPERGSGRPGGDIPAGDKSAGDKPAGDKPRPDEAAGIAPGGMTGPPGGGDIPANGDGGMSRGMMIKEQAEEGVYLRIKGGIIDVKAGSDAIDSNGDIYIEGGEISLSGQSRGVDGAIDIDGDLVITGGTLITAGTSYEAADSSTQNLILLTYAVAYPAGSEISLKDMNGAPLLTYTSKIGFSASAFSAPGLKSGETYQVFISGEKVCDAQITGTGTGTNTGTGKTTQITAG
jgi:hypothetical protein